MRKYDFNQLFNHIQTKGSNKANPIAYETNDFAVLEDMGNLHLSQSEPIRIDMAIIGLCTEGEGEIRIDNRAYTLSKNKYIVILPNQVIYHIHSHGDLRGIFICISSQMYADMIQRMQGILPLFFYVHDKPCSDIEEEDAEWIRAYHTRIAQEMLDTTNRYRHETARALLIAFFYKICNLYDRIHTLIKPQNRPEEIFTDFLSLISKEYNKHREVSYYAEKMFITPKYLSTTIKQVSGQSANEWIQSYVIQEAKIQLKSTHKSIQQIAGELNFPSQSFFGKYFKNLTGLSPLAYRKQTTE